MKKLIAAALATTALAGVAQAQEISEFRLGILGGENAQDRMANNECYADKISDALGVPVQVFTPADYNGVMQGLLGGTIDAAWMGASSYAGTYIADADAVEPVLVKQNLDGSIGYYSIGFARVDSGVTELADLEGKKFGFGDPNSTSGYLIPSVEIAAAGFPMEPGEFFGDVVFTGGHEQTIVAVNNGDVDAGVTWADGLGNWEDGFNSGALRRAVDAGLVDMNDLVQIWQSNIIPEGPFVLRKALPQDVKDAVTQLTADLWEEDPTCAYGVAAGDAKDFIPVTHAEYESIVAARRSVINN
ncbi:Phosphate-import protein PhnD precursor [Pseudooceanicola marinus]|uniref:Phosphate-import protein PhnD n=1 Tax=Pseudooceanicola marinus TaxID=396013 RepID=A0A1X6YSL0_9RHOB|nr:phosphonate ABC transporter substrate-binding protein [Pseudooceanicola marinus]MCA1337145.1 phosphonate ABC transporter substrate-binding protein [Pseudooceanicola marinus]PJE26162.1 phosphonate ABC transporter substrate-binding protein [Pseudooceanicola marinus]SLN30297.1 Phosphate-import protein PhnD precursor [Pseudooceanicola marinus]